MRPIPLALLALTNGWTRDTGGWMRDGWLDDQDDGNGWLNETGETTRTAGQRTIIQHW